MIYTIENYNNIVNSRLDYKLPDTELTIIKNLLKDLGSFSNQEVIADDKYRYKKPINKKSPTNKRVEESWEKTKPFVVTKIEKKEGVDKIMNDIRGCFNKLSNKNYEAQRDLIFKYAIELVSMETNNEIINKIITALIDVASANKIYSDIYANLYKEMREQFSQINGSMEPFLQQYMDSINVIEFVDSNIDYDKYCDNNKLNDKRKGIATFMVNLMKKNIIEKNRMLNLIIQLQDLVLKYVNEENKLTEIEEITENIFILATTSWKELNDEPLWNTIMDNIIKCSQMKAKEHKSLSSRTIFKYMDILDNIQS